MCDEGRHSFPALQGERRLVAPLVQAKDRLVPEGDGRRRFGARREAIAESRRSYGPESIRHSPERRTTNEEAWALKRLLTGSAIKSSPGND